MPRGSLEGEDARVWLARCRADAAQLNDALSSVTISKEGKLSPIDCKLLTSLALRYLALAAHLETLGGKDA